MAFVTLEGRNVSNSSVYSVVELIGSSSESWEKATANAIEEAARSIGSDLRVAQVVEMDVLIEDGKVRAYRSKVQLSYKP
ncbi:MAG: dodecin family protein [Acidimicrobiia bacterium]